MKLESWRIIAIVLAILCVVSVVANIVFIRNFEVTRRQYVLGVQNGLRWLYGVLDLTVMDTDFETNPDMRELRLGQIRQAKEHLSVAMGSLSTHHMGRAGGTGFPTFHLTPILERTLRYAEDPTEDLRFIADKLGVLYDRLAPGMATQDLFDAINEVNDEINRVLWWNPRR